MSADFDDIMNASWDELPDVKPLPKGSYLLKGQAGKYKEAGEDTSASVLIIYKVREAMSDVDSAELDDLGPNYDIKANKVFHRFWVEDAGDWEQVKSHLRLLGIPIQGKITETLKQVRGKEVVAFLEQRSFIDRNGQNRTEMNATSFAAPGGAGSAG